MGYEEQQLEQMLQANLMIESIVPDCTCWIKDYWMNKTWPICDMDEKTMKIVANNSLLTKNTLFAMIIQNKGVH